MIFYGEKIGFIGLGKLGMPCAVAVTDATRKIKDGSRIRVDGSSGVVTILDTPNE